MTPSRRWERAFVLGYVALVLAVPPAVGELYPFSLPSMFSRAPRRLARYTARSETGASIPLRKLHLHVVEWHDPPARGPGGDGYGRRRPPSAHQLGEVASLDELRRVVRWSLRNDASLPDRVWIRQRVDTRGPHGGVETVLDRALWIGRTSDP